MNLTENAPERNGVELLHELSKTLSGQIFLIGQEVIYRPESLAENCLVSGYLFLWENNQCELRYLVETVRSVNGKLEGTYEETDQMIASALEVSALV